MVVRGVAHGDTPPIAVDTQMNEIPTSHRQIAVNVSALGDVPDLGVAAMRTRAKNLEGACRWRQKAQEQAQEGGFPTAVRPQHGNELAGVHGEAGVSPDQLLSVSGGQAIGDDGGRDRTRHAARYCRLSAAWRG